MRRYVIALVAISFMALAAVGGGVLGGTMRSAAPRRSVHPALAHASRPAAIAVSVAPGLNRRLHVLRNGLAGLLGPQGRPHQALSAPGPTSCAVGLGRCSLHPCVEFAVLALPQVTVAGARVRVPQVTASPSPRVSRCRSVPASGQTRLLRVALTR